MIDYRINKLKKFDDERGSVLHGMKFNDKESFGIKEVYFSTVNYGFYKGWKKHQNMVLNLIVIEGKVLFYLADNEFREFKEIIICKNDLKRITIMPNQWLSFTSLVKPDSKIMNIANLTNKEDITDNIPFFKPN
tara:strand:+ start:48683 stop:49084 length:402 start_codon:yes stop_codon:yes gene_type:complete